MPLYINIPYLSGSGNLIQIVKLPKYLTFILVLFLTSFLEYPANAQSFYAFNEIGKILLKQPTVKILRDGKEIVLKEDGVMAKRGDQVITDKYGQAHILLSGGNKVYIAPSSNLLLSKKEIARYQFEYTVTLKGKLRAKIQKVKGRKFRIKTANAMINIKGTDFAVEYRNGNTKVGTFAGTVSLKSSTSDKSIDIPVGVMSSVSKKGELASLTKIEPDLIKGLEHAGRTGIKGLDPKVLKPDNVNNAKRSILRC